MCGGGMVEALWMVANASRVVRTLIAEKGTEKGVQYAKGSLQDWQAVLQ